MKSAPIPNTAPEILVSAWRNTQALTVNESFLTKHEASHVLKFTRVNRKNIFLTSFSWKCNTECVVKPAQRHYAHIETEVRARNGWCARTPANEATQHVRNTHGACAWCHEHQQTNKMYIAQCKLRTPCDHSTLQILRKHMQPTVNN